VPCGVHQAKPHRVSELRGGGFPHLRGTRVRPGDLVLRNADSFSASPYATFFFFAARRRTDDLARWLSPRLEYEWKDTIVLGGAPADNIRSEQTLESLPACTALPPLRRPDIYA